jgi:hypothetical protein
MGGSRSQIYVVACSYRMAPDDMSRRLTEILLKLSVEHCGVIASSRIKERARIDSRWTSLPADNDDLDFSAYRAGAALREGEANSGVSTLFVNDSLFTNHAAFANIKAAIRVAPLTARIPLPALGGKCDSYTTICLRNPWSHLPYYVSTYCFVLNPAAIQIFLSLPDLAANENVTLSRDIDDPEWGSRLPLEFREFVKANLVYKESPYLWYRLRESAIQPQQLRAKARCIYFEHRLSGLVGTIGCILPTNAGPRWNTYLSIHERLSRLGRNLWLS